MIKINFAKQRKDTKRAIIVAVSIPSLLCKVKSATMIAVSIPSFLTLLRKVNRSKEKIQTAQ